MNADQFSIKAVAQPPILNKYIVNRPPQAPLQMLNKYYLTARRCRGCSCCRCRTVCLPVAGSSPPSSGGQSVYMIRLKQPATRRAVFLYKIYIYTFITTCSSFCCPSALHLRLLSAGTSLYAPPAAAADGITYNPVIYCIAHCERTDELHRRTSPFSSSDQPPPGKIPPPPASRCNM